MRKLFALLAIGLAGGAACSSGAGNVSQQLCALASACGGSTGTSFGSLCEDIQEEAAIPDANGSADGAIITQVLHCLQGASDCATYQACVTVPASVADVCNGSSVCSNGYAVQCTSEKIAGLTPGENCAAARLVCVANEEGAGCGSAACDPTTTEPKCNGNTLVTCATPFGALTSTDCGQFGFACGVYQGTAACLGTGAACDQTTTKTTCSGTSIVGCSGGKIATIDCTLANSNATCMISTSGDASCVGAGTQCTDQTPETCANGVITYCSWGTIATVDCTSYGLAGCTTNTGTLGSGQSTTAACTP